MARPRTNEHVIHPLVVLLREEREEQGLTQTMVAQRIGNTSAESISKNETGKNAPTVATLEKWAAALGYHLEYSLEPTFE